VVDGLPGFVLLSAALTLTPGPDDVLVLRSATRGGPRSGAASALGVAAGSLIWGAAAATGAATVVSRSPAMYDGMQWAGAGYLVALGVVSLVAHRPGRSAATANRPPGTAGYAVAGPGAPRRAFAAGLTSDLLNPKIGVFYVLAVPQFVPAGAPVLQYSLLLCAVDVVMATVWLLGLTWVAHRAAVWLRVPAVERWSRRGLGAALIGIGAAAGFGL
jgi:threonine/homoserine/homoserine lactone efflux protein